MIQGRHGSPADIHQSVTGAIAESPHSSADSRAGPLSSTSKARHLEQGISRSAKTHMQQCSKAPMPSGYNRRLVGVWRSLVAHLHGVQGVEGSNPFTPTIEKCEGQQLLSRWPLLL
jgi:hypothetical protein